MNRISFFDCNCSLGRRAVVNPGSFYKAEDLIQKMEYYGIDRALVYHSMAREYSAVVGNVMLQDEIFRYNNLHAVWTVLPHHTGEFPDPENLIKELKDNDAKVVTMFPSAPDHVYSTSDWNCGELFSMLEKYKVPLAIGTDQFSNWDEIHNLLNCHPGLPVILTNLSYRVNRNLYPLMKKFSNLYIETSGYKVHSGIEDICSVIGAERLIFGSGMPVYSGAAAVSLINYASISQKEKQMIASLNLIKLLEGVLL